MWSILPEFQFFPRKIPTSVVLKFFQNDVFHFFQNTPLFIPQQNHFKYKMHDSRRKPTPDCPAENLDALSLLGCRMTPSFSLPPSAKYAQKNPPKHQAAILCGSVLSVRVALPRVANSRWSGGEGMSTEIVKFFKKACTKCTVALTYLAVNLQTK